MAFGPDIRQAKGVAFIGAAKILRSYRHKGEVGTLSAEAAALLDERVLPTTWYPWPPVRELVQAVFRLVARGTEEGGIQMGVAGGKEALGGYHKSLIKNGDPVGSLVAMQRSWRMYFDFGELTAEPDGARAVRFELVGYPDVSMAHGSMIVGWHRAAGFAAGAKTVRGQILESPWKDRSARLVHRVEI